MLLVEIRHLVCVYFQDHNYTILVAVVTSCLVRWLLQAGGSQGLVLIQDRGGAWPMGRAYVLKALRSRRIP